MNFSNRLQSLPVSSVRQLTPYIQPLREKGVHIYHLNIGNPDIPTPECMLDALRNWDKNPIGYAGATGEHDFVEAMQWYYHQCGYEFIEPKHIISTVGGSEAINMAFISTCDPGDEVIVFEPFYSNYSVCATMLNVNLVPVATQIEASFHLPTAEEIEAKITPKTKAILVCSPGNPTGTVYSHEELERLVQIAKKHNLFLISDEVYREYVFDGKEHASLLSFAEEHPDRIIVLDSLSKRYSLCGARVGAFVTLSEELLKGATKLAQSRLSNVMMAQVIGAQLKNVPDAYIKGVQDEYQKRRDILYDGLLSIPGVTTYKPEGAFYTMAALPVKNSLDFCKWLLTDFHPNSETVMLAPGAGFYGTPGRGENEVRIAYVLNENDLRRSLEILKEGLNTYKD